MTTATVSERLEQLLDESRNRILPLVQKESVKMYASLREGHLSLEVRSPEPAYLPDFIEGTYGIHVEVDKENETLGPRVIFTSREPDLNLVFFSLADNLCSTVVQADSEEEAVASALLRFEEFRELMQGEHGTLSQEGARGLIAEHLVLLEYLKDSTNNYEKLIRSWEGPMGGNKDFVFGRQSFEVKSLRPNATIIKISSVDQLDPNGLELYLLTYTLDQLSEDYTEDDAFTLRSLVEDVKDKLSTNRMAYSLYEIALTQTGYDDDVQGFADVRYRLLKQSAYQVSEEFPKLTSAGLPEGVDKVKYSVKIPAIQEFERALNEVSIDI